MNDQANISSHQLPTGTILNNKYEIIHSIGEGGFGITYVGHNNVLDIPVAIKEYYPKGYASRNIAQSLTVTMADNSQNAYFDKWKIKFLAEARMMAKFANLDGIVNVYDFFEQNGTAYIVMEYLDGITLKNYVEVNGPMETGAFFKSIIPVLVSLEKIHKQGLIHRDISPDNLMIMEDGLLKLYDFGAAREYSDAKHSNFSVIIKPCFAPEEQYRSKGVQGPWTDVYAMCATIYFTITGVIPDDSLHRAFSDELKKPSELGVNISPKIESTLLMGMSVRSADRFDSVAPLIAAFRENDNKLIKINGFRAENKPKRKNSSGIFSIFQGSSKQVKSTSNPMTPPFIDSTNDNEKTEFIYDTEYESRNEYLHDSADNEKKGNSQHNLPANDSIPGVKKEIFNALLDNAELGLVPHKPILVCGIEGCINYLKCLYTTNGVPLMHIHRNSISVNEMPKEIDVYDVFLPSRKLYGTLYFYIYSSFTTKAVPIGYVYGQPHTDENDKS